MGTRIVLYQSPRSDHTRLIFFQNSLLLVLLNSVSLAVHEADSSRFFLLVVFLNFLLSSKNLFQHRVTYIFQSFSALLVTCFCCLHSLSNHLFAASLLPHCCLPSICTPPKYTSSSVHPDSHHVMHLCYHPWFHTKDSILVVSSLYLQCFEVSVALLLLVQIQSATQLFGYSVL